jgi:hypothetical protein
VQTLSIVFISRNGQNLQKVSFYLIQIKDAGLNSEAADFKQLPLVFPAAQLNILIFTDLLTTKNDIYNTDIRDYRYSAKC